MATLVLSTVGTALGGPVGSAVGALIGQSIDQELLAPSKRGPRLGDLSVQTSSYGTQIPRIYGTMRVAGSVIWSTDLVEGEATTGAKGQPDTTFGYSVSFAVALSSRPIVGIGRIWADGKLIRDADGAFKVSTGFRVHEGREDQESDPLIASVEGLASTPAYRGTALAVFENLELVEFGNRIPFLTFEVIADDETPEAGSILTNVSSGAVQAGSGGLVPGFAAYGRSIKSAIEPLLDAFALELFDDGFNLREPRIAPVAIAGDEVGSNNDGGQAPQFQLEQMPARSLPGALSLTFYDLAKEFQFGEARALANEQPASEEAHQLAMVLDPDGARSLAEQMIARRWLERDVLTLRLPAKYLSLEPGQAVEVGPMPGLWTVNRITIDGFVVVAQLRRRQAPRDAPPLPLLRSSTLAVAALEANAPNATNAEVAIFEVPQYAPGQAELALVIAGSSADGAPRCGVIELAAGGRHFQISAPRRKAVLGTAKTILGPGDSNLIDITSSVEVELLDRSQWLTSCEDDDLVAGTNLVVLGDELLQFGEANPLGGGRFELRRLLRGRIGTEWAASTHRAGEAFAMMQTESLRSVPLPLAAKGSEVSARVRNADGSWSPSISVQVRGESLRPPSPVHLRRRWNADGDLEVSWVRRSRLGWSWVDEVDAPLGEGAEAYRLTLKGSAGAFEIELRQPSVVIPASDVAAIGTGTATLDVRQIGDWGTSHPCRLSFDLH